MTVSSVLHVSPVVEAESFITASGLHCNIRRVLQNVPVIRKYRIALVCFPSCTICLDLRLRLLLDCLEQNVAFWSLNNCTLTKLPFSIHIHGMKHKNRNSYTWSVLCC
jgi:hypothetical protein